MVTARIDRRPQKLDILMTAGDSLEIDIEILDENDSPLDLTGKEVDASFSISPTRGSKTPFSVQISGNTATISLTKEQTTDKPVKNTWDCQLRSTDGSFQYTMLSGQFVIENDVTQ